jgi:steroid delta-isomerase-like uncharacterized protein
MATAGTTSQAPVGASNAELVRWTVSKINERDFEALRETYAPGMHERFPDREVNGADEIIAYFEEVTGAFSGFHLEIVALAEDGEQVFIRWVLTGRHTGAYIGIEATNKELKIDGMDNFVVREGKIHSNFVVFDRMQFAQQLGVMPPDDSRQDRAMKSLFNAKTKLATKLGR